MNSEQASGGGEELPTSPPSLYRWVDTVLYTALDSRAIRVLAAEQSVLADPVSPGGRHQSWRTQSVLVNSHPLDDNLSAK